MRARVGAVTFIVYVAVFATLASPERHGRTDSIQNHAPEVGQTSIPPAKAKQSFPRPNWMVKCESGSVGLKRGQWLRLGFVPRDALAEIATPVVGMTAEELVTVEFSAKTEKASHLMQGPRSGCSYAHGLMPDPSKPNPDMAVAIVVSPGAVSRLAEKLNFKHPVRFIWNHEGKQESLVVKVTACEYQSFIANAERLVGSRWREVGHDSGR